MDTRIRIIGSLMGVLLASMAAQAQSLLPDTLRERPVVALSLLPGPRVIKLDLLHMPSPYSYHALGLFCKAEVRMNSWLPIPVMVRLGDVQRAEELDGKGPFRDLYAR